jgi:hypothetical protein
VSGNCDWAEAISGPIEPLGYHSLDDRPGFKLALKVSEGRSFLYVSHLWHSGWSVLDVTDPASPELVRFMPGPPGTWTLQVTKRDNLLATSLEPVPPAWGGDADAAFDEGVLLWDVSQPSAPRQVGQFKTGHRGTHRNLFDDHGLLHVAARADGYEGMILVLVDVSDPSHPTELGRFGLPEQHPGAVDADGETLFGLHGPSMRVGDIAFLPYGNSGLVTVDVSDPRKPALVGRLNVKPPLGGRIAAHSAVPLPDRDLLVLNSEALAEGCAEPVGYAALVDIGDPAAPRMVSLFPTPSPPAAAPYSSFCAKGGRFSPHNQHTASDDPDLFQDQNLCFLTYFNAGLRVFDTSNAHHVAEVAYVIPKTPERRLGPLPKTLRVQVEDVLVDARGIAYFTEKNSGLYIAKWRGGEGAKDLSQPDTRGAL